MGAFGPGEQRWVDRLSNLRNVVRQEVIARQVARHARPGTSVLDVGCGQGTQAIRLAAAGCRVTGVDPSAQLLERCRAGALDQGVEIELHPGRLEDLEQVLGGRRFDLVCCHGVLMYLDDRREAIAALAARVAKGGLASLTVRNAHALAMRPGLRGRWADALRAFDSPSYVNELGIEAVADRLDDVRAALEAAGLAVVEWYGVRVLNDAVGPEAPVPPAGELALLLEAEERAGSTDPYRWMASQLHVVARRPGPGPAPDTPPDEEPGAGPPPGASPSAPRRVRRPGRAAPT